MAEETKQTEEVVEEVDQEEVDTQETTEQQPEEELIPKSQMEQIIKDRVAREKKAAEKAVAEAEKLAKMNADEKEKYEREQLEERLAEYERKDQFYSLSKEASKMLAEHDIHADDEVLQLVVKDSAEYTSQAVNAFVEIINTKVEEGVQKALSGRTPKANVNASQAVTQEDFNEMGYSERVALKQKDEKLYNKLKGE